MEKTYDYSLFKISSKNRGLDERNLNEIIESLKQDNLLHLNPIIVDKDYVVLDGQHRLEACKELGLPIYYVRDTSLTHDAMATLNMAQKKWDMQDYAHYYSESGDKAYQLLLKTADELGLSLNFTLQLLGRMGGQTNIRLKKGNLELVHEEVTDIKRRYPKMKQITEAINQYRPDLKKITASARWLRAYYQMMCHPEYDHAWMLSRIDCANHLFCKISNTKAARDMLTRVYNHGKRSGRLEF